MNSHKKTHGLGLLAILAIPVMVSASATEYLSQYHAIVLGDFNGTTHVHGTSYIGGSITNGGALDFAVDLHHHAADGQILLTLGGSYVNRPNNLSGHIGTTDSATTLTMSQQLKEYATQLSLLSGTTLNTLNGVTINHTAGVNIQAFSITKDVFEADNMNFTFSSLDDDDYIVFNVSDADLAMSNSANFNYSNAIDWSHVIWNFHEAENLSLKGFYGNILAPYATLTLSNDLHGNVTADQLNGYGQIHINGDPYLPEMTSTVPAPSAVIMAGLGVLTMAVLRRRAIPSA